MTKEDYDTMVKAENERHKTAIGSIIIKYAKANNHHHIGDTISDHMHTGVILGVGSAMEFGARYPSCRYKCQRTKKDGSPRKRREIVIMCQGNVKNGEQ